MRKHKRVLFLALQTFGVTGGIEKVCRIVAKALYEMTFDHKMKLRVMSMYEKQSLGDGNKYFPSEFFYSFRKHKARFVWKSLLAGRKSDIVILSHINLLVVGWMIKKIHPRTKIILFTHGIEVWGDLSKRRKMMLRNCDRIISVSRFTSDILCEKQGVSRKNAFVLNNCLDPFLPQKVKGIIRDQLKQRYGFSDNDKILFTLTRMSARERYKGYDKVIESIPGIIEEIPNLKYLIAGPYDEEEKLFLTTLIDRLELSDRVKLAGFIKDDELIDHFKMADAYVMPSMKEGFGIVFIEAMFYELPVIAGNIDGSVDALMNGELGILVNPNRVDEIATAILNVIKSRDTYLPDRKKLISHFGYDTYKEKLKKLIEWEN